MRRTALAALLAMASAITATGRARADTVDFDDMPPMSEVLDHYPAATFSVAGSSRLLTQDWPFPGHSLPNIACTTSTAGFDTCAAPVTIDFTSPVSGLTFVAIEPNGYGVVATIAVYENGVRSADVDLIGLGPAPGSPGPGNALVDLSRFSGVTRIEILPPPGATQLDEGGNGIGWDDFSFVPDAPAGGLAINRRLVAPLQCSLTGAQFDAACRRPEWALCPEEVVTAPLEGLLLPGEAAATGAASLRLYEHSDAVTTMKVVRSADALLFHAN